MDPIVESAIISAAATLVGVGGTVAVAIVGFQSTSKTNRNTINSVLEGQVTDRYTKAIEQLGSDKIDVRTGGIYALERIAHDSAKDHPVVMEMLTAFIREHSREQWPPPDHQGQTRRWTRRDAQAAVTVVGRRDAKHDIPTGRLTSTTRTSPAPTLSAPTSAARFRAVWNSPRRTLLARSLLKQTSST
jgi:hypothetical protein